MAEGRARHTAESVRNIALVGHARSGKTTLAEELLALAGAIKSPGSIEKGNTVSDFTDQEKRAGHSLDVSVCHLEHDGARINLLDTPGYPDFVGRTLAVLPAVETAAVVINAQAGIEFVSEQLMTAAAAQKLCRLIVVNRIDESEANPEAVLAQIRAAFGGECLPLNLPAKGGQMVADCFFEPADVEPDFSSVETAHTEITDQVVELDDALMELYLEQGENITLEQLHDPFERALRRGHLIPVCFTSAKTKAGLRQLLRIFSQLMPNPFEGNPLEIQRGNGDGKPFRTDPADESGHFIGHVFKLTIDPYVGRLATFRVHQGSLRTGDQVFVGERRKGVKIAHLYRAQGRETQEVPTALAGDICSIAKVDGIEFNDILHTSHDEDNLSMTRRVIPEPMHALALSLTQRGQEKKLSDGLHKLVAEDPSLAIDHDPQTNETILRGMGELHLRLALERLREEFNLDVETHAPKVPYRETVTRAADGHCRHKKQTGGAGQFGEVFLKVEPLERGGGFEFVDQTVGGSIPGQFIPAVEKGVRQALSQGAVTGNPIHDVRVVVYDGKHHPVDSKEIAFVTAGKKAFLDAVSKANPIVLEPIARIEITLPNRFVGDITGHLAGIRGRIGSNDATADGKSRITAQVPIAELDDFQATLKSLTGGEGVFTLQLDHYASAPTQVQKTLEQAYRPSPDAS
jgi:elongation factor G